ncbi:MAG: hypothetical protein WBV39_15350 [Rudaea sp.]
MSATDKTTASRFDYVTHWQTGDSDKAAQVLAFWRRQSAIGDEEQAQQRLSEVVLDARAASGEIAGVCTAVPITLPRLAEPMYYYRCFVGTPWRRTRLVYDMMNRAFDVLEKYARENAYPCIGVLLELENAKFGTALRRPVWPHTGFIYIGKSPRNLDLRVRYFRGAHLHDGAKA